MLHLVHSALQGILGRHLASQDRGWYSSLSARRLICRLHKRGSVVFLCENTCAPLCCVAAALASVSTALSAKLTGKLIMINVVSDSGGLRDKVMSSAILRL